MFENSPNKRIFFFFFKICKLLRDYFFPPNPLHDISKAAPITRTVSTVRAQFCCKKMNQTASFLLSVNG